MQPDSVSVPTVTFPSNIRGILFDMDGVLIDSEPVHERAIMTITEALGRRIDDHATLFSYKGIPEKVVAGKLLEIFPGAGKTVEEVVEMKLVAYAAIFGEVELITGAREFVIRSKEEGRLHGLTTSASRPSQQLAFAKFGLDPYFEAIITGEDIRNGKPHPEPYLLTAERLGLAPEDCVVIEDSVHGVRSGKAAGCFTVGLTSTFPREMLVEAGADVIIDSFAEIG